MRKMTTFHKLVAATVAVSLVAGGLAAPSLVLAKRHKHYSACEARKEKEKNKGLIIGAVVGGLAGNLVTKKHKVVGTVAGGAAGAYVGQKLAKDKVKCG